MVVTVCSMKKSEKVQRISAFQNPRKKTRPGFRHQFCKWWYPPELLLVSFLQSTSAHGRRSTEPPFHSTWTHSKLWNDTSKRVKFGRNCSKGVLVRVFHWSMALVDEWNGIDAICKMTARLTRQHLRYVGASLNPCCMGKQIRMYGGSLCFFRRWRQPPESIAKWHRFSPVF